jgi:hypothetical protein
LVQGSAKGARKKRGRNPLYVHENGNRKSDGAGSYTYETTSNRMSTRLGLAVTFDAAGNLTADGTGRTFTYNEFNQMDQVFQGGVLLATYEMTLTDCA